MSASTAIAARLTALVKGMLGGTETIGVYSACYSAERLLAFLADEESELLGLPTEPLDALHEAAERLERSHPNPGVRQAAGRVLAQSRRCADARRKAAVVPGMEE